VLREPGHRVAVIHAPTIFARKVLAHVATVERRGWTEAVVALRIVVDVMHAEEERITRLPRGRQRGGTKDGIGTHDEIVGTQCERVKPRYSRRSPGRAGGSLQPQDQGAAMRTIALTLLLIATVGYAAEPVVETKDQAALLKSADPQLAANKKLVFDMWRTFINAYHVDEAGKFLAPEYHQHNPNATTGLPGVIEYFKSLNLKSTPVPDQITNKVVSIVAERDLVVVALVREEKDKDGKPYTSTWFDMYRIANGKIVEHWDTALKGVIP